MKIKICGLRDEANIHAVAGFEPDYMGFIFYDGSARYVGDLSANALRAIPAHVNKTAVFVNENAKKVSALLDHYGFDFVQLHGDETPAYCKELREQAIVIKAFGINDEFDFDQLNKYKNKVDLFLFDTKTPGHGGSGKTFNWDVLDKYDMEIPFFLSGGIGPENIDTLKQINHPQFYGIDLNSKFETEPGLKDLEKLSTMFESIKKIDEDELRS